MSLEPLEKAVGGSVPAECGRHVLRDVAREVAVEGGIDGIDDAVGVPFEGGHSVSVMIDLGVDASDPLASIGLEEEGWVGRIVAGEVVEPGEVLVD